MIKLLLVKLEKENENFVLFGIEINYKIINKKMDSKAGSEERNTHDLNRAEGIKTKLERRKRRLDDYLLSKRILPNLPTEAFIEPEQQYKAPEALEDKTKKKRRAK